MMRARHSPMAPQAVSPVRISACPIARSWAHFCCWRRYRQTRHLAPLFAMLAGVRKKRDACAKTPSPVVALYAIVQHDWGCHRSLGAAATASMYSARRNVPSRHH